MNPYYLGTMFNTASIYMTAGLGACFSLKSGDFNLGGEGQIYAGGLTCALLINLLGSRLHFPPFIATGISLAAAFLISSLMTLLSTLLKKFKNADFLLTSFIISAAVIPIIDGLIAGPLRGNTGNLLATAFIPASSRFTSILPPSTMNLSFFVIIIMCIAGAFLLYKTRWGIQTCIYGKSRDFALYSGFSENKIITGASFLSGGFHGLAGALAVCGTYYTCHSGFYAGLGWNALSAAMIARANPILLIPSSIAMSALITYSSRYALFHNFDFNIEGLIQGTILFLISIPVVIRRKK